MVVMSSLSGGRVGAVAAGSLSLLGERRGAAHRPRRAPTRIRLATVSGIV